MENLSGKCRVIATLILILGIIGSIYIAYKYGVDLDYNYWSERYYEERNWVKTVIFFIVPAFGSFATSMLFYSLEKLLDNQDYLIQRIGELEVKIK